MSPGELELARATHRGPLDWATEQHLKQRRLSPKQRRALCRLVLRSSSDERLRALASRLLTA